MSFLQGEGSNKHLHTSSDLLKLCLFLSFCYLKLHRRKVGELWNMHRMLILPSQTLFQQPTMPCLVIHAWKWSVRKCLFIWTYLDGLCSLWLPPHARRLHASTISTILRSTFSTSCHIAAHFSVSVPGPDKGVTSAPPVHRGIAVGW